MATCLPVATAELRVMGQDDHANLAHQNAGESWDPILAERSFEENDVLPEYWAKFGGSWDIETSGAYVGDNYLEFTPSGANQYVYQSMNWVGAEGDDIDVRIAFKSLVGAASGDIEVELYRRVVEYDPWAAGDCFYVSGEDQNDRDDPPNSYVIISGSFDSWSAATSWQEKTSPTVTVNPPAGDHWDVRLRVYSDVNFSGNWTTVALDKLRIRDKG